MAIPSIRKNKMEFDVESFMFDVTAALAHGSSQRLGRAEDAEDDKPTMYDTASGEEAFSAYEEFLQYPSDECSNTPSVPRSLRSASVQSVEFLASKWQNYVSEDSEESVDGTPAMFDIGMFRFFVFRRHGLNIYVFAHSSSRGYEYRTHNFPLQAAPGSFT